MRSLGRIFVLLVPLALFYVTYGQAQPWIRLLEQADSLAKVQDYGHAIIIGEEALELAQEEFGSGDSTVAAILYDLGVYRYEAGAYAEAASYHERALEARKQVFSPGHVDIAESLKGLAVTYKALGRWDEGILLVEEAISIWTAALGPEDSTLVAGLATLGDLYGCQGRYSDAEPVYKRAIAICEMTLDPKHTSLAYVVNNLGWVYSERGRFSQAEPLLRRALVLREEILGPNHASVALTLDNLGSLCWRQGKYAEAEVLHIRAMEIFEQLGHHNVSVPMYNLANLYGDQDRYKEAEELYKRALKVEEDVYDSMDVDVALSLESLAALYDVQKRYSEAEPLHLKAMEIFEHNFGPDSYDMAFMLINVGNFYQNQDRYDRAEENYRRAMDITLDVVGPEHPFTITAMMNLASLYTTLQRFAEAESLFEKALLTAQETLGSHHPDVAAISEPFCRYYRLVKNARRSVEMGHLAFEIRQKHFTDNGYVLSERDALKNSGLVRLACNTYLSSYLDSDESEPDLVERTCDVVLASKGCVSDIIFERRKAIIAETDTATTALVREIEDAKIRLSQLFVDGPEDGVAAYRADLDLVSKRIGELESKLARRSKRFRELQDLRWIDTRRVTALLPENSVLLEYLRWDYLPPDSDATVPRYLVVVLGSQGVRVIEDLGDATAIDSLISAYRHHMLRVSSQAHMPLSEDRETYYRIAQALYDLIIRPVGEHLRGMDLVLVAPDGGLNLVSFAGLVDKEGHYLIEGFPIHYLSAGRELVRFEREHKPGRGLIALGDPDYDAAPPGGEMGLAAQDSRSRIDQNVTRSIRSYRDDLSGIQAKPLPQSRDEINRVIEWWEGETDEPVLTLLGREASESNFKANASGKRIIHVSTHGYFLEPQPGMTSGPSESMFGLGFVEENPLLLSGLMLAGVNVRGRTTGGLGCEDGVLTAYEVSEMDLTGIDMVVLSACETGLGAIREGEGVYGLRRAFRMAGARTVVSALWPVSDETTGEMMARLYSRSRESLPLRLRHMQLAQIEKLRTDGLSDHPYNWAGFIAIGDGK
jgi:CHAT domain-containing protein/Tfp pilus assembly protein PilF